MSERVRGQGGTSEDIGVSLVSFSEDQLVRCNMRAPDNRMTGRAVYGWRSLVFALLAFTLIWMLLEPLVGPVERIGRMEPSNEGERWLQLEVRQLCDAAKPRLDCIEPRYWTRNWSIASVLINSSGKHAHCTDLDGPLTTAGWAKTSSTRREVYYSKPGMSLACAQLDGQPFIQMAADGGAKPGSVFRSEVPDIRVARH